MMSKNSLGTATVGILGALLLVACSGQDGTATAPEAVGKQSSALIQLPIQGPTGNPSNCKSVYECVATSGYPDLVIDCPETVIFSQPGSANQTGIHFQTLATDILPTYPVSVTVPGGTGPCPSGSFGCPDNAPYPTYLAGATSTTCGTGGSSSGGGTCRPPTHDCGDGTCAIHCQ
jgi:hypothetical protein